MQEREEGGVRRGHCREAARRWFGCGTWVRKQSTPTDVSRLITSGGDLASCSPWIHSVVRTFLRVPSSSTDADLLTYVDILTHYTNISNATLINVTATYGTTEEWLEQRCKCPC